MRLTAPQIDTIRRLVRSRIGGYLKIDVDRFGLVLVFMKRLQVIDQAEHW